MNKIFFRLLHNRSLRRFGYDLYLGSTPEDPRLPLPVISSFTATPSTITTGEESISNLQWTVTGATSIKIGAEDVTNVLGLNVKPAATTTYTLQASNSAGSVTRSVQVVVAAALESVKAEATASNLSPTAGQVVEFKGSASGGNGGYSYAWSFSDGLGAASTQDTSRSFSTAGTYAATLSVTSGDVTVTDTVELSISSESSGPTVSISHSPANPVTGDEVTFVASVSGGVQPYSYAWTFADGTSGGTDYYTRRTYNFGGGKTLSLTVTGGGSTTATYQITVSAGYTPPAGEFALYQADPAFDPATGYPDTLTRNLAQAFVEVMSSGVTLRPELEATSVFSVSKPTHLDLYKLRSSKMLLHIVRGVLSHKRDPRFVALLLPFVKTVLDNLVTEWTTYPHDDTPGKVDSNGIIIDRYASDSGQLRWNGYTDSRDNRNGGGRGDKDGYARWIGWGQSTSRQSPRYRNERADETAYKKILYTMASAHGAGIGSYGTHKHTLDNLMAHVTLGWACYILDVNRDLNAEYQIYGQLGFEYIFNHWLPLTEQTLAQRKPDSDAESPGVFDFRSAITHNVGAHANLYPLLIRWREFRGLTPDPRDVQAAKLMMQWQIDQVETYNMPAGLYTDSSSDKFGNWAHHNNPYHNAIDLGSGDRLDQASMTYDREFGGELYNLYRMGFSDTSGRVLTKSLLACMARTFAFIVYPKQTGSTFTDLNALGNAGGGTGESASRAYFNDGSRKNSDGSWGGSTVPVKFGRSGGAVYSNSGTRHRDAFLGGWYMWAEDTPELLATRRWMRRAKHCTDSEYRLVPDDFQSTAAPARRNAWHWTGAYLIYKLENPERTITGLDLSF